MKRSDLEMKVSGFGDQLQEMVGKNPLLVAGAIFGTGYFSGILWKISFPLVIIAGVGGAALWFLSDQETKIDSSKEKGSGSKKKKVAKAKA